MMQQSKQHTSAKDLWTVLRRSPALLATVVIGGAGVLYLIYKYSSLSGAGGVVAPTNNPSGQSPYYIAMIYETKNQPPPVNVTVNNPPDKDTGTKKTSDTAFVRSRNLHDPYDNSHPQGVPIRQSAGATNILKYAPWGTSIILAGNAVSGGSNFGAGSKTGSTQWIPVKGGGYISAYDVTGIQ